jgi:hypothetical protein
MDVTTKAATKEAVDIKVSVVVEVMDRLNVRVTYSMERLQPSKCR